MKKVISMLFMFMMVVGLMLPTPVKVYADGNGIDSFNVTYDSSGNTGLTISGTNKTATQATAWQKIFTTLRGVITGVAGVATLVFMFFTIKNIIAFGAAAGNTQKRQEASKGILYCGLATAGLGAVTMFFGIFYNLFAD